MPKFTKLLETVEFLFESYNEIYADCCLKKNQNIQ